MHKTSGTKTSFFAALGLITILWLSCASNTFAQEPAEKAVTNDNIETILLLLSSQAEATWNELEALSKLPATKRIQNKKEELLIRLDGINENFENIATRMQTDGIDVPSGKNKEWLEQIQALTKPVLDALSDVTAKPRRIEHLKKKIEKLTRQLAQIKEARENIKSLLASTPESNPSEPEQIEAYRKRLKKLKQKYNPELVQLNLEEAKRMLRVETENAEPLMDTATSAVQQFFKTRGRNLVITLGVFIGLWWVLMRFRVLFSGKKRIFRLPPWMNKVLMTVYSILVLLFCIISSMVTLYILNDWLLLSVIILFLFAVAWASRQLIPRMFQEVRLAMNLGTVKEQERLLWKGVPWMVESIGLQATLTNENLQGGTVQLPVGDLVGLHSRPVVDEEPWFPTSEKDWVLLSDGTYGQVKVQTMEQVILTLKGETQKTFLTSEFLSLTPRNISHGFRYEIDFGLDYSLQSKIVDQIPEMFQKGLRKHLASHFESDNPDIKNVEIAFDNASGSSLILKFLLDVDGRLGGQYIETLNEVQNTLITICNENDLKIPVSQLALSMPDNLSKNPPGTASDS